MNIVTPPITELIPHSGPMVLLDEITKWEPGAATCRVRIRPHAPFVVDGRIEACVTVEYMAQAVAGCLGHEALLGGDGVRVGMIIACKSFDAFDEYLYVGDEVTVTVSRIGGNEAISHFDCELLREGAPFTKAVLTLYHSKEPPPED